MIEIKTTRKTSGARGTLATAVFTIAAASLSAGSTSAAANSCVATYGPANGYRPAVCSYSATGPGRYVAAVSGGGFEIYVDGKVAVWGWGSASTTGNFPANAGQTVTVVTQCDRGVYCAAQGSGGAVAAADR